MQGRGRGSYLGLILESTLGKSMVGSIINSENWRVDNKDKEVAIVSPPQQAQDEAKAGRTTTSPVHSTWTSLDLLGNRGRKGRQGKDVSIDHEPLQENIQENLERNSKHTDAYLMHNDMTNVIPVVVNKTLSPPNPSQDVPQCPSSIPIYPAVIQDGIEKVHLCSPEEFLPHSSEVEKEPEVEFDSSSETYGSTSSASSRYIPPHQRKGFNEKPEVFSDTAVTEHRMTEKRRAKKKEPTIETAAPQKIAESELNWQKWKLQRNFKKMLNSLAVDSAMGLSKDIEEMLSASQLSSKFPGVSEVKVILDLLVGRVLDQKEMIEVAVQVCRLLNAMYPDELPYNLRDVLKEYRMDAFSCLANKNSRCDKFCLLLGKLCDVAKLESNSFNECLIQSVIGCLLDWISPFQGANECSHEAELKVIYLCDLLELTKNTIDPGGRSWIKSCFGNIKNCILNDKVPRDIREMLLDAIVKHSFRYSASNSKTTEDEKPSCNDNVDSALLEVEQECLNTSQLSGDLDLFKDVKDMLSELQLGDLLEKFQENLIRDSLLRAEKNELKNTLQEAGFAPGAVLEIQRYLEKNGMTSHESDDLQTNNKTVYDKSSPSAPLNSENRVKNLESSLQQILGDLELEVYQKNDGNCEAEEATTKQTELEKMKPIADAQDELAIIQANLNYIPLLTPASCHPPPGFSNPGISNSRTAPTTSKDGHIPFSDQRLPVEREQGHYKRDVFVGGKKLDGFTNKDGELSFGNQAASWPAQGHYRRISNERDFSKQKGGRGRGRRDTRGSLESSRDTRGSLESSRDTRGSLESSRYRDGPAKTKFGRNVDENEGTFGQNPPNGFRSPSPNKDVGLGSPRSTFETSRPAFGASMPVGCFICGSKQHRSAYCKNNAVMFD